MAGLPHKIIICKRCNECIEKIILMSSVLCFTARRQKVWDVTRVAAMFCLLYDTDSRWTIKTMDSPIKAIENNKSNGVAAMSSNASNQSQSKEAALLVEFGVISREHLEGEAKFHHNEDFLRLFAEINFIYAEALVELTMREGFKFLEKVKPVEDTKLTPSASTRDNIPVAETDDWLKYAAWMDGVSKKAMDGFLRASSIGVELNQSWIVCNAGIYFSKL